MAIEGTTPSEVDTNDVISVLNRLNYLANKSRVGTPGIGPDKGKEFKGGLTSEEMDESNKLSSTVEQLLKVSPPVYGIKNSDGTTTLSYTNPTAKEEAAYRQQYGANTSLAQAGVSPYGGGKVLNWQQKQEAMKRVEELRPKYASLSYAQQQEFDAIQRNLYASILVNADNANPKEANATSISDNTPALLQQYGQWGPSEGVQVGAAPGSMPGATSAGPVKTLVNQTKDSSGSITNSYSDGSTITVTKSGQVTSGTGPASQFSSPGSPGSPVGTQSGTGTPGSVPSLMGTEQFRTVPTVFSPAAAEYNEYLKGKATAGTLKASELRWTKDYNTHRYETLKGKAFQGLKLTAQEQAESDFLINLGVQKPEYNPGAANKPVGTPPAYVYDGVSKSWKMPDKPTAAGTWVFDANEGWVDTTVVPGSSGIRADGTATLALDTFKNTLSLLFGAKEASQPWVTALYTSSSKFYNSGSTISESINLSLQDVRYNKDLKPFTDRFSGIYALTDRLAKGEAIEVPTVAEYFQTESAMGDVLRSSGMGELANQNFLGSVIGLGKSVLEVTKLITDTFDRIDNAPSALKEDLKSYFPGADRTSIAKAMLTGAEGAAELTKKVKAVSVQSAAKTQGVNIDYLTSEDIAAQGYDYNMSLEGFRTVNQTAQRGATLGKMSNIDFTQQEAIASTFQANADAAEKIRKIKEEEVNRFSGTSGRLASKDRALGII
jgi:hypothetical protein